MRSRGPFLLAWLSAGIFLVLAAGQVMAEPTHYGTGAVKYDRIPWFDGVSVIMTQGWGGCYNGTSHCPGNSDQYGTDWNGPFLVYAVSEGNATCAAQTGWGNRVLIDRENDNSFDRYAHLPNCPFTGTKHYEQGDFISVTGCTGICSGNHLHYQKENSSQQSQTFELSGLNNFCDHTIGGFCSGSFDSDNFVSDNAGPGVNSEANLTAWSKIQTAYTNLGHYLCPPNKAWTCFGSSRIFTPGDTRDANRACYGASNDCGWHQDFQRAGDNKWNDFNWPEACSQTYWIPDQFFVTYVANQLARPGAYACDRGPLQRLCPVLPSRVHGIRHVRRHALRGRHR